MYQKPLCLAVLLITCGTYAESITHGPTTINMDFVNIGGAGNPADTRASQDFPSGAVGYDYWIGKYEVTIEQFMTVSAADGRVGDGDEGYWNDGIRAVGIGAPASFVSPFEAMKFANWLTSGDAHAGAYQFDRNGVLTVVDRAAAVSAYGKVYVLPTTAEWYKAAYYRPANDGSYSLFANGLDTYPIQGTTNGWNYKFLSTVNETPDYMWKTGFGGEEQNGTYDMTGNIAEWSEDLWKDGISRTWRGGHVTQGASNISAAWSFFTLSSAAANVEESYIGFRVAMISEP